MALISLRAYNREIEGMIDNGQLDEAVAHCRHILTTFPKHIASYRLMGKAHLEQQRISDATDIFQRVLSAIPDDFISNVGMSIIREDENNLDAAIWHMELAYEAQPANIAIQDELRRLYGRRDGMQPPKVRLTRGALARMYAKGSLFDQAIAELRAAIAEDPNRPDLQLLLAQMLYQTSQRVEAVDVCVNILKKMPLCLEANRILAVSLPETEGSDAVKNSRQIVVSMDPYYAFAEPEAISSDMVPENAVNIERLEWKSGFQIGETPNQPAWATSLGINMEKPAEENIPDWLKAAEAPAPKSADDKASPNVSPFIWDTQEVEKIITDTSKPEGELPDWMKDAGWKPATGESTVPSEQMITPEEPTPAAPASQGIEQADIPEWLRGIAPDDFIGQQGQQTQPEEDTLSNPWLEPHQPGPTDSIIHWLEDKQPGTSASSQAQEDKIAFSPDDEVPDWLKDLDVPQASSVEGEKPDVPASAVTNLPPAFLEEPVSPEVAEIGAASAGQVFEPVAEPPAAQAETPPSQPGIESKQPAPSAEEEIPDWLKDMAVAVPAAAVIASATEKPVDETPPVTRPEQAEQPAVAVASESAAPVAEEKPAQGQAADAEVPPESKLPLAAGALVAAEMLSKPEEAPVEEQPSTSEAAPVAEVPTPSETPPALETPPAAEIAAAEVPTMAEELPAAEPPPSASEQPQVDQLIPVEAEIPAPEPDSMNEAVAFAWLEGLAAEQDAKEQGIVAAPIEGELQPPEWVKLDQEPITEEPISVEPPAAEVEQAQPVEEVPDWIKGLGEEPVAEPTPESQVTEALPESVEAPVSTAEPATGEENPEELPAWLLEMEQPQAEENAAAPYDESLEWKVEELPDWLKEITESEAAKEAAPPEKTGSAAEVAAAAAIAGLVHKEETAPAVETGEQVAEVSQPESLAPIPAEAAAAPVAGVITPEIEASQVSAGEEITPAQVAPVSEEPKTQTLVEPEIVPDPAELKFTDARNALNQGQSSQAVSLYTDLIKQNYHLGEIIKDLQEALYRFPVDVDMWVTLGDAQTHTHDLQEALNAYTKAEELVR